MNEQGDILIGIQRHRINIDGKGVCTLVAFHGCPLRCKYCLNPQSLEGAEKYKRYTPQEVYDRTRIDQLYFLATGGGVTFGGGEPALHSEFIEEFRQICGEHWAISLETSLNVPQEHVKRLLPVVNCFIVDVKDMDGEVYHEYTGKSNERVIENLRYISDQGAAEKVLIRLPLIKDFNTPEHQERSRRVLEEMGYKDFDLFEYRTDIR